MQRVLSFIFIATSVLGWGMTARADPLFSSNHYDYMVTEIEMDDGMGGAERFLQVETQILQDPALVATGFFRITVGNEPDVFPYDCNLTTRNSSNRWLFCPVPKTLVIPESQIVITYNVDNRTMESSPFFTGQEILDKIPRTGIINLQLVRDFINRLDLKITPIQLPDADQDGTADAFDNDKDGDDILNDVDNCPETANTGQENADANDLGDACDDNDDEDTKLDTEDNCPLITNEDQTDADGDRIGDICDEEVSLPPPPPDVDKDSVEDSQDNCPVNTNPAQEDTDGDGLGDICDPCPDKAPGAPEETIACQQTIAGCPCATVSSPYKQPGAFVSPSSGGGNCSLSPHSGFWMEIPNLFIAGLLLVLLRLLKNENGGDQ